MECELCKTYLYRLNKITMKNLTKIFILFAAVALLSAFQIIKTQLTVTVRDDLGNIVTGATVKLYETEDDYNKEENVAAEGTTDDKGKAKFKELKAIPYYLLVEKGDKNNFGGGEQTGKLEEKKINQVTVVIQ